ncbi:MAG TPA: hypothetical protein VNE62_00955 [Actinomycetota bacterium]|nr:hypothetical protein [Actinomycetota bacterium]
MLCAIGLLRGLFWVGLIEVWGRVDEAHHYAYAESIATGDGIPVVGRDRVSVDVLRIARNSPTPGYRSYPVSESPDDPRWGLFREQYEAVQGPTYYVLLGVPYLVSRPFGPVASVYGLRLASLLISLTAIPLVYLLARELFPRRRAVWLLAPAVMVFINGYNANLAAISNDALAVPLAAACLLSLAWLLRRGPGLRIAAIAGFLLGLAVVTKTTLLGLLLISVFSFLWMARRWPARRTFAAAASFGAAAVSAVAPWLAWNLSTYGALSGGAALNKINEGLQPKIPLNLDGIALHFANAGGGFWEIQGTRASGLLFGKALEWIVVVVLVGALIRTVAGRDWTECRALFWLAASVPACFAAMLGIIYIVFGGEGTVAGRHLYGAFPALCVLIAAGLHIMLGPRWWMAGATVVLLVATARDAAVSRTYADLFYTGGLVRPNLAPVVEQAWIDSYEPVQSIAARSACPVRAVGLWFGDKSPRSLLVDGVTSRRISQEWNVAIFRTDHKPSGSFFIDVPPDVAIGTTWSDRDPRVRFAHRHGDPALRLYCAVQDPASVRFAQQYGPQHPDVLTYTLVRTWGWVWSGLVLVSAGLGLWTRRMRRVLSEAAP